MKANVQLLIFGIVLSMVSVGQLKAQLNFTSAATVTIDFSTTIAGVNNGTYAGTGLAPSPAVGQLDSDGLTITGIGNTTGGSISSNFFILPPPDALFAVTAGVDTWFGMSPLGDWSIVLQVDNNIPGTSIYSFDVDFQMLFRNLSPADQTYKLEYAPSPTGPWTQFGGTIELPPGIPTNPFWLPFSFGAGALCTGEIASGSSIYIRLSGAGVAADALAFNTLTITPVTTPFCTLTNITSFTTANVEDVTLDLNWAEDGSGDCAETYLVVGREGVAPASDLVISNLQGLYEAASFNANSNWAARTDGNEVWTQTFFTLGADEVDYFVYKGSGTSVTISGLEQNSNYNFLILATGDKCSWVVGNNITTTTLLPIELASFTAEAREKDVLLEWRTETEVNNDYMVVERSADGVDFFEIGRVRGAGNTQIPQQYSFVDEAPISGTNYYRLRQVDFDGTVTYYRIITVSFDGEVVNWQISPNLVHAQTTIHTNRAFEAGSYLQLIDVNGKILKTMKLEPGAFRSQMDLSDLIPGAYFIQMNRQGRVSTKRIMKK
jgi:hypothetical protein